MKKINLVRSFFPAMTFGLLMLISCNKPVGRSEEIEREEINSFLSTNPTYSFQVKNSGLYYLDIKEGTGSQASIHDTAYVNYICSLLNGTTVDYTTKNDTLIFPVGEGLLIPGFDEGIAYMKEGGTAIFLLPSDLAYGSTGSYGINPYTPLLYRVELARLKKYSSGK